MSSSSQIQCPNPTCLYPENPLGRRLCDRCQTPLVYRYLWAVGEGAAQIPVGTQVVNRYTVMSPQIWLDTQPGISPDSPPTLPDLVLSYNHLFPHRLHVPEVYGVCQLEHSSAPILLLSNSPIDPSGQPFPALTTLWAKTAPIRQVYWFWQLLELWTPLLQQGVAASLLMADNVRVEGWRVRLRQLEADNRDEAGKTAPSLRDLGQVWLTWIGKAETAIAQRLHAICQSMQSTEPPETVFQTVSDQLNRLLLEQTAQVPPRLRIIGATATGPQRFHNEDACYPPSAAMGKPDPNDPLLPHGAMICDGIGGHAGGEVASQLALRTLQLQLRALLTETAEQSEAIAPDVVIQQLEAVIRVGNNLIATQNDEQGRESRQRMGTTLVMALQLPQKIATATGIGNSHELYLAHVGDSRAYWITPRYCHQLTVDDDVASREVRLGRSLYQQALKRPDAGALTQALGTRDSDVLYPTVQRLILDEEGILLLCSDGLSDNDLVEQVWEQATRPLFKGKASLEVTAQTWVDLANQHNGHDNTSVVLMHCQVSQKEPDFVDPTVDPTPTDSSPESPLSEASRALLYDDVESLEDLPVTAREEQPGRSPNRLVLTVGLIILLFFAGGAGLMLWRGLDPIGFGQTWERWLGPAQPEPPGRP